MTRKCLIHGCQNHSHEGRFVGELCGPCYDMLTTGKLGHGKTWIHDTINTQKAEIKQIHEDNRTLVKEIERLREELLAAIRIEYNDWTPSEEGRLG